jgi:transposase
VRRWWREKNDPQEPPDHALGRSRGGFSTKIHLTCEGHGHPLHFELTAGQDHESTVALELIGNTTVHDAELKSCVQPAAVAGDKAYRAAFIVEWLNDRDIQPVIPEKGERANDESNPDFDRELYRKRNIIERLIGWLKESRRIFSRFEKTAVNFGGMIKLAFIHHYLRAICP